ncbi:MAG TPA: L-threonylcarbamoyladenylate synthase, partial [Ktedonobacterales bacterium]|nr:L-threonylcarbamoyladenylate synthase [Ktedonobacterales bacterium]
ATNAEAVAGIFAAKGRPRSDPLITHIPDVAHLSQVARDIPPLAFTLAERFWPGPLTLVLPRALHIPPIVAAGGETVGVRAPDHPIAQALLSAAGVPVAAPSANRFMGVSPTTAAHVLADLDGSIGAILDGGPTRVGVESTVVDLTIQPPRILRPGGATLEALRAIIPNLAGPADTMPDVARDEPAHAPGQLARHYAPTTRLIAFDATGERGRQAVLAAARVALERGVRVGALATDDEAQELENMGAQVARLGPADDLAGVAQRLYAALRALDDGRVDVIYAHTFDQSGLGLALWDRLRRAAGGVLQEVVGTD